MFFPWEEHQPEHTDSVMPAAWAKCSMICCSVDLTNYIRRKALVGSWEEMLVLLSTEMSFVTGYINLAPGIEPQTTKTQ
jgi:hypothetical protein